MMDYIAYDAAHHQVWVPAGNTASVDVIDTTDDKLTRLDGFATREMERKGKKRTVGPSAAAVGGDVIYIGNRGDSSVCAYDAATRAKKSCLTLDSMPDGIQVVASRREVWVTTPRDREIQIIDASRPEALALAQKLPFEGEPEGFAVDAERGFFYTNLEDKDRTLAISLATRQIVHTWEPKCGEDGPKGLAIDLALDYLLVACPEHVLVLDAAHDGKALGRIDTGDGIDAIDYVEARHELFAAAAGAARLTIATLDKSGTLTAKSVVATAPGARNAVATEAGVAYLTDAPAARILIVGTGSTPSTR
jgi:DNA-binding beta-propeller fold protein YncE